MPAGDYNVYVVNQGYATKAADLSVMFYFLNQKGTVTSWSKSLNIYYHVQLM
jgi:hypothetical protein